MPNYKAQSNIEYKVETKQSIEQDSGSNSKLTNSTSSSENKNIKNDILLSDEESDEISKLLDIFKSTKIGQKYY